MFTTMSFCKTREKEQEVLHLLALALTLTLALILTLNHLASEPLQTGQQAVWSNLTYRSAMDYKI